MRKKTVILSLVAMTAVAALLSGCITSPKLSYQGKLTNPAGTPVPNGNYNMTFRLWGTSILPPFDPIVVWEEDQTVPVTDGLFNVVLGNTTPLTPSLFVQPLELGIEVNGDGEMTPRQPLTGAPYAMTLVDGAVMGGTAINIEATSPGMLNVANLGTGYGIAIQSYGKAGVAVDGVDTGNYGFIGDNIAHGIIVTATDGIGYRAVSTNGGFDDDIAVRGHRADQLAGLNDVGVFGWSEGEDNTDAGVTARAENGYGVYAFTFGTGQYGGYFADPIFVNGGCTGCAFHYVGRNAAAGALQPGDTVRAVGVEAGLEGLQSPVMKVAPAVAGQAVLGVVLGRVQMNAAQSAEVTSGGGANFGPVGGAAAPGDYLVIVVQGPAQVQADPAAGIQAGSLVYLGSNGVTTAANGPAIGMALDVVGPDGLVWVLVGFH